MPLPTGMPMPRTDAVIEIDDEGRVTLPEDPRDATIQALAAEVERLAKMMDAAASKVDSISRTGRVTVGPQTFNPDGTLRGGSKWNPACLREPTPQAFEAIAHRQRLSRLQHGVQWEKMGVATVAEICELIDRAPKEAAHGPV